MDIIYEVAKYIANAGYGVLGTNIFAGQIPAGVNGIWVEYAGASYNNYVPMATTIVDVYIKSTSASDAIMTLNNLKNYLHRMHSTSIDNAYIYSILVIGGVDTIQRDAEYAKVFKISLSIMNRDTTLIS